MKTVVTDQGDKLEVIIYEAGVTVDSGSEGNWISGEGAPSASLGEETDYYHDTASNLLYGPKHNGAWPVPFLLKGDKGDKGDDGADGEQGVQGIPGIDGIDGQDGVDGNTVLHGTNDPTTEGTDGDFYINTSTHTIFGPKASGTWPSGTSLIGPKGDDGISGVDGSDGEDGLDGKTILNGTTDPTTEGVDGDFYINTATNTLFGPKSSNSWPVGVSLVGPSGSDGQDGADGTDGTDGRTILNGLIDPTTEGENGDFFINTSSNTLFGPKTGGSWGVGVSLVGPKGDDGTGTGSSIIDRSNEKWVIFGDSFSSLGTDDYPYYVVQKLGMNLANCESHALSGNTLNNQNTVLDGLASTYFDDKDLVTLHIGVNDFATHQLIGKIDRTAAHDGYFVSEMKYFIETIQAANPEIQIYLIAPIKIWQTTNKFDDPNNWGYVLKDYIQAMKDVASLYSLPVIDLYNNGKINDQNHVEYLDVQLVHPNSTYLPLISDIVADGLLSHNLNYQVTQSIDYSDIVKSKNLFNKETVTEGVFISNTTGGLTGNATYNTSDFIPVEAGETYTPSTQIRFSCYFDSNGDVVSGGISSNSNASFTVPAGAVSVRVTISVDYMNYFQLEKGTETTKLSDYWVFDPFYNNRSSGLSSKSMQGAIDELADKKPVEDSPTTELTLDNTMGRASNFDSANSNTAYTIAANPVLFGSDVVLINASTEPTVENPDTSFATKITGADFVASTDMYMVVNWMGETRKGEYYFISI